MSSPIEISNCMLIILTHRDHYIDSRTLTYLQKRKFDTNRIVNFMSKGTVIESRNRMMKDLILPNLNNFEWFIFMDQDNHLLEEQSDPFFKYTQADIVGCRYEASPDTPCNFRDRGWLSPEDVHMGCLRIHTRVFQELKELKDLPWFMFEYNQNGTKINQCECGYFHQVAKENISDLKIERRGACGHLGQHSWYGR